MKHAFLKLLCLACALCLTLSSCLGGFYAEKAGEIKEDEASYDFIFTKEDEEAIYKRIDYIRSLMELGAKGSLIREAYYDFYDDFLFMYTQNVIAMIRYDIYGDDEGIYGDYMYMNEAFAKVTQANYALLNNLYCLDCGEEFFSDWTEEQIAHMLFTAGSYTNEFIVLSLKADGLLEAYRSIDRDSEGFKHDSAAVYSDVIKNNNAIAAAMGYDGYMAYAYDIIYNRGYTPEQSALIGENVRQYIVPLLKALDKAVWDEYDALSSGRKRAVEAVLHARFGDEKLTRELDGYYEALNKKTWNAYRQFIDGKNYFLVKDCSVYNSYNGAYTVYLPYMKKPVIYMGESYMDAFTFVHEFGHYISEARNFETDRVSYDLMELQSQGNEFMYLAYLENTAGEDVYDFLVLYMLWDALTSILQDIMVNDFEIYAYANPLLTPEEMDAYYASLCEEYGGYEAIKDIFNYDPVIYWHYVTVESPGYYLSYTASLIPAIELYITAKEDFGSAAEKYYKITSGDGGDFLARLEKAGLSSPLESEAYVRISEFIYGLLENPVTAP